MKYTYIWLHYMHSSGTRKLIFSADTDVYHIGMTQISHMPNSDIIVQLSKPSDKDSRFIQMNSLIQALENDPDLSELPPSILPQILQSVYVATGCEYTSFFCGLEKASFLSTLFQYATFIALGVDPPGSLGIVSLDRDSPSLYSFLRLVGCAYFRSTHPSFHQWPLLLYFTPFQRKDKQCGPGCKCRNCQIKYNHYHHHPGNVTRLA